MRSIFNLTETTRFSVLPHEVLEIIVTFNEQHAVRVLQNLTKRLIKDKIYRFKNTPFYKKNYLTELNFKGRKVTGEEAIKTLNLCKCCDRHQLDKPFSFVKWVENQSQNNGIGYNCKCLCRHQARMICRYAR